MNKSARKFPVITISVCVLIVVVIVGLAQFINSNKKRIIENNAHYLEDATKQSVKTIDEFFTNASDELFVISYLFDSLTDLNKFDYKTLAVLTKNSLFDYMRFIDKNGTSYSSDGEKRDVSDRPYFLDGIKGNSGISFVTASLFTGKKMLAFYTPFYHNEKIVGVLLGAFNESHLNRLMSSSYFSEPATEVLCTTDGVIIACSNNSFHDNIFNYADKKVTSRKIKPFIDEPDKTEPRNYTFRDKDGTGNYCVLNIPNRDWILIKIFPSKASTAIINRANSDALKLETLLFVIFTIFITLIGVYYFTQNKTLSRKTENYSEIINSIKELYERFVLIDFEKDNYTYFNEGIFQKLGIPKSGVYSKWLPIFAKKHFNAEYSDKFQTDLSAKCIKDTLTLKNRFVQYEYQIDENGWEKLSVIKLNMDKDETTKILIAVEDVTELKKIDLEKQQNLENALREAEVANNAKREFLSRMSHDIRTPMNAIIGLTSLADIHLDDINKTKDYLQKITSSSKYLLSLINEIMDMSKIESGKWTLAEKDVNLAQLIDDVIKIVYPMVQEKKQTLKVRLIDVEHENVRGDALRLQQIFINILSNAVKYTNEGGNVTMTLNEQIASPDNHALLVSDGSLVSSPLNGQTIYTIIIEDDGIGMSKEFIEKLYVPFERAEDVRISKTQGTGLGMSIVQNIIKAINGTIEVESEIDKGTKFTIKLPLKLKKEKAKSTNNEIASLVSSLANERGLRVFGIDDDVEICKNTVARFKKFGIEAESALNAKDGLAMIEKAHKSKNDYFAIFVNYDVSGENGIEITKKIRKIIGYDDSPKIILCTYDYSQIQDEAKKAGVDAFVTKPLFKSKLQKLLLSFIPSAKKEKTENAFSDIAKTDFKGKKALLVEDNLLNREIATEILEMTGLSLDCATDGKNAVEIFEKSEIGEYAIIFMDIQMPNMNGYEATTTIRSLPRADAQTIPIIAMTANAFEEDVQTALACGMNSHLAKPLEIEKLVQVLESYL